VKRLSRSLRAVLTLAVLCTAPIAVPALAQQTTLQEAVSSGRLVVSFEGTGASSGDSIKLKVKKGPKAGSDPVDVTVPPGTMLGSNSGGFQGMVVTGVSGEDAGNGRIRPASRIILAGAQATYILTAYCAEFEKENPSEATTFSLRDPDPMLACVAREGESLSLAAMQAAVWKHTDKITYAHMSEKFDVTPSEWAAAQKVYSACRARQ
jgi:hypothetical protein